MRCSSKVKFFIYHLIFSFILACVASIIIFYYWHPAPLALATGVIPVLGMLFVIDIVIGPLIGVLVYKQGKKTLKFDLTVVIVLQFFAFSYGMYVLSKARPAWIVYTTYYFEVVKKSDINIKEITQVSNLYRNVGWGNPKYVATKVNLQQDFSGWKEGEYSKSIYYARYPQTYTELKNVKNKMEFYALDLKLLKQFNTQKNIDDVLRKYPEANAWFPLKADQKDMVVLINKMKGEIVQVVNLRPWQ